MKFFEIGVLLFFSLWLLFAIGVAFANKGPLLRIRKFLWFNGWFNQWTMFMPDKSGEIQRVNIFYRDKNKEGEIGPWQLIELEKPWKPTLFLLNPDIRLYGFMISALRSFTHLHHLGRPCSESSKFNFFQSIMLGYERERNAEHRQIKVEQIVKEEKTVLILSDFLKLA